MAVVELSVWWFPPPFAEGLGAEHQCLCVVWGGLWCTGDPSFVVPSLLRVPSQPSSLWMLFWSLLNVDVKQFVCPLLRKNSLFKKQSCGYEVAYLS